MQRLKKWGGGGGGGGGKHGVGGGAAMRRARMTHSVNVLEADSEGKGLRETTV